MKVGYVRVSSLDQNVDRQMETLKPLGLEKIFVEKISGKDMNRPQLLAMLEFVRAGDSVVITDFSRLARNLKSLITISEQLEAKGVQLISLKENIDTGTPQGKLMLSLIGAINEFERAIILERQAEGIALAKQRGAYKGRKSVHIKDFDLYYKQLQAHETTKAQLATNLGISRPTLDKLIREFQAEQVSK